MEYTYDHNRKGRPYQYTALPMTLSSSMPDHTEAALRALRIGPREKSLPPLFQYVMKEDTHTDPQVPVDDWDKFVWERHSPVIRSCDVENLQHRLFAITEESTLPDGRRDVLTSSVSDDMYITGGVDRGLETTDLKKASYARLKPYQKTQGKFQGSKRKRDGTPANEVTGSRVIVVRPREMFWPEEFVLMQRLHGEKYDPIQLGGSPPV
jgi:hypothetical protein